MADDWTPGEARIWARRLRKVGFSPVTLHHDSDGTQTGQQGGYYLRCNWPFDLADAPLDVLPAFVTVDYGGYPELYGQEHFVGGREPARRLLAQFRAVRLGMGSRPLPAVDAAWEPQFIPTERLWWRFDWPLGTQQHPDYHPDTTLAPEDTES